MLKKLLCRHKERIGQINVIDDFGTFLYSSETCMKCSAKIYNEKILIWNALSLKESDLKVVRSVTEFKQV